VERSPIIIHVPHSSTFIPPEIRKDILLSDNELQSELLTMTDWYTEEFAAIDEKYGNIIKYGFSRLVVDPERFRDDTNEIMSTTGMGAVYVSTSGKKKLRILSNDKRELLLKKYYDPYHNRFEEKTDRILSDFNKCLIIDIHSFPTKPLPYELNPNGYRPDICIGMDDYHTPKYLIEFAKEYFSKENFTTAFNTPFSGTFVPIKCYQKDERISSIMIEIKRCLYMNETTGEKTAAFIKLKNLINQFIQKVSGTF
jgi:N-formylglutamate deformylase